MSTFVKVIQSFLRVFGLRLTYAMTPQRADMLRDEEHRKRLRWLRQMGVKTIVDVGANTGQFSRFMHAFIPEAQIYAFEPLPDCYKELLNHFTGNPKFKAFNVAVGNQSGEVTVFRNDFTPSSSLLPMAELHKENFPQTRREQAQILPIARLDDLLNDFPLERPLLLKLDVQGFEREVILGASKILQQADVVVTELSVEFLYEGQPLFDEIYNLLLAAGFQYQGNFDQLCSPVDGRVLQMDGIFRRRSSMAGASPVSAEASTGDRGV